MKILIIEDDLDINQNIQEALMAASYGYDVAFDGLIGEKLIRRNQYDCIILDINLPHKNGFELCRILRSQDENTPVLLLTAFDELDDKVEGFEAGADDYLTKPFYMKELLVRVRSLIKRSQSGSMKKQPEGKMVFKDIIIDLKNSNVRKAGQEIQLTPREFQILLALVNADGELVPKRELIKSIWGTLFEANTNTIEVYINFLRNKIDKPFGVSFIKTKIGYGYYLDAN